MKYTHVMSIAGSDCSGGAGIQADIKTISALGSYASSVITAVTVQNTCGVSAVHPVPAEIVKQQIEAIRTDMLPDAVKIGMVTDEGIIRSITEELNLMKQIPIVFDPVLVSSSGFSLITPEAVRRMQYDLIPLCYLLTPNLPEAELLSGIRITDDQSLREAGKALLQLGCRNVLIKGGHRKDNQMTDALFCGETEQLPVLYSDEKVITCNTHGTGCTLSSAIATFIAQQIPLTEAIRLAKKFLTEALKAGSKVQIGHGHGPLNHFFDPKKAILR